MIKSELGVCPTKELEDAVAKELKIPDPQINVASGSLFEDNKVRGVRESFYISDEVSEWNEV